MPSINPTIFKAYDIRAIAGQVNSATHFFGEIALLEALRVVQELRKRKKAPTIAGLVLIAPAPDFTVDLIEPNLSDVERRRQLR